MVVFYVLALLLLWVICGAVCWQRYQRVHGWYPIEDAWNMSLWVKTITLAYYLLARFISKYGNFMGWDGWDGLGNSSSASDGERSVREAIKMEHGEQRDKTREEAAAKWQRRQKQDQRRTEELEREPWRLSKRIKAQDPYHFVIMPTLIERLLGISVAEKIAIDKLAESITVESRYLLLIHRQRVIPFSAVRSVVIDYKYVSSSQGGGRDFWTVSLNTHNKKVQIGSGSNEDDMSYYEY